VPEFRIAIVQKADSSDLFDELDAALPHCSMRRRAMTGSPKKPAYGWTSRLTFSSSCC
jgi:hypothetical protein